MKRFTLMPFLLVAWACSPGGSPSGQGSIGNDYSELSDLSYRCRQDAEYVPVDQSEHCVKTIGLLEEAYHDPCADQPISACDEVRSHIQKAQLEYQHAITNSVFLHGKSLAVTDLGPEAHPRVVYHSEETMRSLFEKCLEQERLALEQRGFVRINAPEMHPLGEGQMCYRSGYPEFLTRPAAES